MSSQKKSVRIERPEARRRLFLSFTKELSAHARAAEEAASRAGWVVFRLDEGSSARPSLESGNDVIRHCEAMMVLLGTRYGFVPSKAQGGDGFRSFEWLEVAEAERLGKPIYAFLLDRELRKDHRDWGNVQRLRIFLEQRGLVVRFTTPEDLAIKVEVTLRRFDESSHSRSQADVETPRPDVAKIALAPERARELLELTWRLVAGLHCPPDLLLNLDPARVQEGLERATKGRTAPQLETVRESLRKEQSGLAPNPLWMAWMTNVHSSKLAELALRLDRVRGDGLPQRDDESLEPPSKPNIGFAGSS